MGDQADMILDGTICSVCGVYLGSDDGVPKLCRDCEEPLHPDRKRKTRRDHKRRGKGTR